MKLTKYEHACFTVEKDGQLLVVDPGELANLPALENVVGIVITHKHGDHLSLENISKIAGTNPNVKVLAAGEVLNEIESLPVSRQTVNGGDKLKVGEFELEFFGKDHAVIYESIPCQNIGVMIDGQIYYPGDSFTLPGKPVKVLACPASAPWMKTAEAIDFLKAVKPERAFPTHNGLLSEFGETVTYNWLQSVCQSNQITFLALESGDQLEV